MPKSALPEHLQDVESNFPDDKQFGDKTWWARFYTRFNKTTKTWFAFSYRCTEWWARWRRFPMVLLAVRGKGEWRWEDTATESCGGRQFIVNYQPYDYYLSRIQYYTRWHFAVQWPLMVSFHFYPKAKNVPTSFKLQLELDGKLWFAYWNHFDADLVYWMVTSVYLGRNWK